MAYGIVVNGRSLGGLNSPSLLATLVEPKTNGNYEHWIAPSNFRPGNAVFCAGTTGWVFGSSTNPAVYGGLTGWRTEGANIILRFTTKGGQANFTNFNVYQVQRPENISGTYGIMIQDSVNWMSINSDQQLGFVVWKGDVSINDSWEVPVVQNDSTKIVFVRCDDEGVCVSHRPEQNRIYVSRENGEGEPVATTAMIRVLIMNSGYYPPTPNGYGLVIKNALGQNTFTSDVTPLVWDGRQGVVDRIPDNVTWTGLERPMIPIPICGYQRGNREMNGGYYNYHTNGFRFVNGGGFRYWRGRGGSRVQTKWSSTDFYAANIPLMVINADHYF